MSKSKVLAAGFVLYRRCQSEYEYLLLQASHGSRHWTPPKGHVEPGESLFDAAIRETEEESGLTPHSYDVETGFKPVKIQYLVKNEQKEVTYWLAKVKENAHLQLSDEHQNFKWCSLQDSITLSKYVELVGVFHKVHDFLMAKNLSR